jgi:hypothetical protein
LRWAAPGRGKGGGYRVIYYVRRANGLRVRRERCCSSLIETRTHSHGHEMEMANVRRVCQQRVAPDYRPEA